MRVRGVKKQMRIYNALVFVFFNRLKTRPYYLVEYYNNNNIFKTKLKQDVTVTIGSNIKKNPSHLGGFFLSAFLFMQTVHNAHMVMVKESKSFTDVKFKVTECDKNTRRLRSQSHLPDTVEANATVERSTNKINPSSTPNRLIEYCQYAPPVGSSNERPKRRSNRFPVHYIADLGARIINSIVQSLACCCRRENKMIGTEIVRLAGVSNKKISETMKCFYFIVFKCIYLFYEVCWLRSLVCGR
ncbi:hypothetical protein QTP88_022925 [Uroleucon formosanum]